VNDEIGDRPTFRASGALVGLLGLGLELE